MCAWFRLVGVELRKKSPERLPHDVFMTQNLTVVDWLFSLTLDLVRADSKPTQTTARCENIRGHRGRYSISRDVNSRPIGPDLHVSYRMVLCLLCAGTCRLPQKTGTKSIEGKDCVRSHVGEEIAFLSL